MSSARCLPTRPALFLTALLLAAGLLPTPALASWIDLGGDPVGVTLVESDGARSVIEVTVGGFEATPVTINGATYFTITLDEEAVQQVLGFPALPDVRRSLIVADDREMVVTLLSAEHVDLPNLPVAPSKGNLPRTIDPATVPYTFDAFYTSADIYPQASVEGHEPYILRDFRGMVVDANVFQYLPGSQTLRVYTRMRIEIAPAGPSEVNALHRQGPIMRMDRQFAELYAHHFLNFVSDRYTPVLEDGGLLIITYDSFRSRVEPLYEWKLQKGIPTRLVTVTQAGGTATAIKAYILNEFNTTNLSYVLLVGDAAQVPTFTYAGGGSDPTYSLLAGGDSYPDIFVGRFSAENTGQVDTQVERTITYERDPMPGAPWYQKGTGIASDQGPGHFGEYDYQHENLIRQDLLNYGYTSVDQIYDPTATAQMVTNALNEGRGILNYTGHGDTNLWGTTGFSNSHVDALVNTNMLPFIESVACLNGNFTGTTCFAEAWLRATDNNGRPAGAIATYMSTISQSWNPPMDAQDESVDLLAGDDMRTIGGLWYNGSCKMIDLNGAAGVTEFMCWTIFGDPSLAVRSKVPQVMNITHSGVLLLGQNEYQVTVSGVSGALCALYADGVLYGSAVTAGSGLATIQMTAPPTEPMTLTLTVTAYNKITYEGSVDVIPASGPYLLVAQVLYVDGNGDGVLNAGEGVDMRVLLRNVGSETAANVSAAISSPSEYITITTANQTYSDIAPGGQAWSNGYYHFGIAPRCPDQLGVVLPMTISGDPRLTWDAQIAFTVLAPTITAPAVVVDDSAGGNGNGRLDPGESATLTVTLDNGGSYALNAITGVLSCGHPQITVGPDTGTHPGLGPDQSGNLTPPFGVAIDPAFPMTMVDFILRVTGSNSFDLPLDLRLPVGGFFEPVENGAGSWEHYPVSAGFTDQWHISTERNHTPSGSHSWKCGDAGTGTYANLLDAALVTPPVQLGGEGALRYWQWIQAEVSQSYPGKAYDGGLVEISIDGGPFTQITPAGGYPYTIRAGGTPGPFPADTPVFSGTYDWHQVTFDLSGIVGTVVLRFRFGSDGADAMEGWHVDDVEILGTGNSSDAREIELIPLRANLAPSRPNPFGGMAQIRFGLSATGPVALQVFDAGGRLVRTLVEGTLAAGFHTTSWSGETDAGRSAASGIYFYRLKTAQGTLQRSMVLMR